MKFMKPMSHVAAAVALACGCSCAAAQPAASPPDVAPPQGRTSEPNVKHVVIEDDLSRIEELRIRGLTRRISVQPKGGQAAYEIIPIDPGRETPNTGQSSAGGGGQRVWPVLRF